MSINEKPKGISIRYIVRNNSANSNSSPTANKSFVSTRYNSTITTGNDADFDTHFMTLLEDSRDDAFIDSANEADENDNQMNQEQHHFCSRDEPIYEDRGIEDEEIAMECRVIRRESTDIVLDAPKPTLDTAAFSVNYPTEEKFNLTFKSLFFRLSQLFERHHSLPFLRIRLFSAALLLIAAFILPSFLTGLATGIYISLVIFLFLCVSDPLPKIHSNENINKIVRKKLAEKGEDKRDEKIYKGWMNILNEHYRPHTFHVNTIQTVLVRLDGNLLRISRPERVMLKHCFYVDPTLSETEPRISAQNIYDLTGAKIKLRPRRLARRRWFSRKYPICIKLAKFIADNENPNGGPQERKNFNKREQQNGSEGGSESSPSLERNTIAEMENLNERSNLADNEESATDLSEDDFPIRHSISDFSLATRIQQRFCSKKYPGRYIFLFARSAREKERWFHKLRMACSKYKPDTSVPESRVEPPKRHVSFESLENLTSKMSRDYLLYSLQEFQFTKLLEDLLGQMPTPFSPETSSGTIAMDLGLNKWQRPMDSNSSDSISPQFVVLVNLVATRLFYDFCRDRYWCESVRNKIQTKLATIHLPYFIETLELSTFDLGTSIPKIMKVYKPTVDEWGIWCDFEIKYSGLIKLGLETRVNLMKLKSVSESTEEAPKDDCFGQLPFSTSILRATPSRYSDEEMPESPETSPDEEFGAKLKEFTSKRQKTGQKILSLVDRLAHSKYFREASELKPIRKMMEEISSTRLMLNVEVTALEGIMTANFPPPPSDRLWYGFRVPPQMSMRAIPQVGDRSVVYSALSDWIENKLQLILEKNLVLPNMDDVVIPLMSGNQLLQGNLNR